MPHLSPKTEENTKLIEYVASRTGRDSRLETCIQCGTCGGSCPSAMDMEHTPRDVFALLRAGERETVLSSNTPWICVSCYFCAVRCPQEIKIPDVMYTLKSMAITKGAYQDSAASDFSQTFVDMVENYGRSYELGLATRHYLRHFPLRLPSMAPMGMGLLSKKRLNLKPKKIQGIKQLNDILDRAKELEAA
ncbi:MAG: hypothetical protein HN390_03195 [Anaerolineae bacterium]|mgnify:CR=1 FL=1|nr:hypothetical protein [Anaerolineae bacterium]MBT7075371.1 hypothetical protein [Anaerolineae bacterium]MBT7989453.1 hypothetical protein [Anaerolineae bacterium]